jgi:alpha-acetolactate decarboxylase
MIRRQICCMQRGPSLLLLAIGLHGACDRSSEAAGRRRSPDVASLRAESAVDLETHGTLHGLMEGKTSAQVSLASLRGDKNLVALGSLSELRGEVWIFGGEVWVSYPKDDKTAWARELGTLNETAAFLVKARVREWQTRAVSREVPFDDLPAFVEGLARGAGLDPKRPFPIVIEGELSNLALNVVDGRGFTTGRTIAREELLAAAAKAEYPRAEGVIVGFFSSQERPDFVHPGARLHLHVLLRGEGQVGHVDRVSLTRTSKIRLPTARRQESDAADADQ